MLSNLDILRYVGVISLLYSLPLSGQVFDNVFSFHHLTSANGLTSSQYNYNIYQDSMGFVWISSIIGLNRFDGHRIKHYRPDEANGFSLLNDQASQSAFGEVPGSGMWFTNDVALTNYDHRNDQFRHYQFKMPNGEEAKNIYWWCYVDEEADRVFTSGNRLFFSAKASEPENYVVLDDIHVGVRDRLQPTPDGGYILMRNFFGENRLEIRKYYGLKLSGLPITFETPDSSGIRDAHYVNDSLIWVATKTGLKRLNISSGTWTDEALHNGKPLGYIESICLKSDGDLILGTATQGVFSYSPVNSKLRGPMLNNASGEARVFRPPVVRMYLSRDNTLWVSTKDDGVYFANVDMDKSATICDVSTGRKNGVIRLVKGLGEDVWIAGATSVSRWAPSDTIAYKLPISGQELEQVKSLLVDRTGTVWVGTLKFLLRLDPGASRFEVQKLPPEILKSPGFNDIRELSNGDLLLATNRGALLKFNRAENKFEWHGLSVFRPRIIGGKNDDILLTTLRDSFLIGSINSVDEIEVDTIIVGLPYMTGIIPGKLEGDYWIGTHGGLYKVTEMPGKQHAVRRVVLENGAPVIYGLGRIGSNIIMSVTSGVISYNVQTRTEKKYHLSDGLQGSEFIFRSAMTDDERKVVFLGGGSGAEMIREEDLTNTAPDPKPTISNILINYEEGRLGEFSLDKASNPTFVKSLRLPYRANTVDIQVTAMVYGDPENCYFRYDVTGPNQNENRPVTKDPFLSLSNLREGDYLIGIHATNSDNVWSGPRLLSITILPPWYRTWWAYTLYGLAIAGIAFSIFWTWYQGKRRVEKEQLLRAKSEAKAAEIETQAAQTETSVLRLQMNPHFIFNSLNSVNSFIETGKTLQAQDYLYKFADLIRDILRRSEQPLTRLDQAIQLLTDYLEAEQMRMGDRLAFVIEEDDELDTFSTYLPTMIIQPFVENAIWHGISGREDGGTVTLRFGIAPAGNQLLVEVEDDGVGRQATAKSGKKHASKAIDITRRRLDLLNSTTLTAPAAAPENAPAKTRFEIQDLKHPDGTSAGTRILLYLPLNYEQVDESNHN